MRGGAGWIGLSVYLIASPDAYGAPTETLTFYGQYQAWKVYRINQPDLDVCYAATRASQFGPSLSTRTRPILYITRYPKTSSVNTVELRFGGDVTQYGNVSAKLLARRKPPKDRFTITVKTDAGFVADADSQTLLTRAMKKGRELLIVSEPGRGIILEDRFSLFGYTKALAKLETLCPGPEPEKGSDTVEGAQTP